MMATIVHRGPDSSGLMAREGMAFGMRRLSIIDLAGGDQPIENEDGSVIVVFNGEIYNFRELRAQLQAAGHTFRTNSDTEVIVHGYEEWGDELPVHLGGMFAFSLWDANRQRLLVARDRFGKKPLYYSQAGGVLRFASEIKALLAAGVPSAIDDAGLAAYLELRYVPAPATMFREVRQLLPGHLMVADASGLRIERWWRLVYGPKLDVTLDEAASHAEGLFRKSVEARLISEVPLGCFLSGGLDSSMVLAMMSELRDQPVSTFSVGFSGAGLPDELPYARVAAEAFGARHHEVSLDAQGFLDLLPTAIWHRDEPLAEPSEIPLLTLSRLARESVTVVLSGEGGDELFGGYPKYRADRLFGPIAAIGGPLFRTDAYAKIVQALPKLSRQQRLALSILSKTSREARWPTWFGADPSTGLSRNGDGALLERMRSMPPGLNSLDAMLALDVESYLADNLLIRGDKMTMAASIEARMPLLDHTLAEYVARLPANLKTTMRTTKIVMRQIAAGRLPQSLLERPKVGFAVPVSAWMRGWLGGAAQELILGSRATQRALVDRRIGEDLLGRHRSGALDAGKELWSLVNLELWARIFMDGDDPNEVQASLRTLVST
jgi:asparagine synthase (glutamine-hydrolysing)